MVGEFKYASVILHVKFSQELFYILPDSEVTAGCWVKVQLATKHYYGVVYRVLTKAELPHYAQSIEIKPIEEVADDRQKVEITEIKFWEIVAKYWLCTVGEVFKAAYPIQTIKQEEVKAHKTPQDLFSQINEELSKTREEEMAETQEKRYREVEREIEANGGKEDVEKKEEKKTLKCEKAVGKRRVQCEKVVLSEAQEEAYREIEKQIENKTVLLEGVTGSGKTEIYINLIDKELERGKDVLYMVPEISMSTQLEERLKKHYGARLFTFHSRQTAAKKKLIREILSFKGPEKKPVVVLGTRSSVFLPFNNLGLIVIDEEHDTSYKQEDPAPRYNGRDAALFLAQIHKAKVLMGSATPSFETLFNCISRKFARVLLKEKYFTSPAPEVTVIDTIWTRKSHQMKGSFSQQLINLIENTLADKKQVLVFRNIRSFAPVVQCADCGEIIKCSHCNVPMSYHRYDNTLRCHYCETKWNMALAECPKCKGKNLEFRGAGTERIEEELKELFPTANIARYDRDISLTRKTAEKVLKQFSEGETDILVGTQMISKGFDFKNLTLVAVIQADTILSQQDFRADEKSMQLFIQLLGRSGRRDGKGHLVIQTNQKDHPVIQEIVAMARRMEEQQREAFARRQKSVELGGDSNQQTSGNDNESVGNQTNAGIEIVEHQKQVAGKENFEDVQKTNVELKVENSTDMMAERSMYCFPPFVRMVNITLKHKNLHKLSSIAMSLSHVLKNTKAYNAVEVSGPYTPRIEKVRDEYQICFTIKFARDKFLSQNKEGLRGVIEALKLPVQVNIDVDPS